jgi:hypothetical protein
MNALVFLHIFSLIFPTSKIINLGEYISRHVQLKISKYLIAPTLYEKYCLNYQAKDFEELEKYLHDFCKVKVIRGNEYTLFVEVEE